MSPGRPNELAGQPNSQRSATQGTVHTEQTRLLYANAPIGAVVSIINGLIAAAVLWYALPRSVVITWFITNVAVVLVRLPMVWKYHHASPTESTARRWRSGYTLGAVLSGATWGALAVITVHYSSLPYQLFVAFVVGGMAIGAIAVNASFLPAYLGFLLPALLPLAGGFFFQAKAMPVAMGALILVFTAALYFLGRNVNSSITRAIELSLEKQVLADTLHAEHQQTVESNRRLAQEAESHRRTSAELRNAHEDLERKVTERTGELIYANDRLWQEIHERQRAEAQRRKSGELFQATFEQAAVGMGHVSTEGQWLQVNDKLCDILGYAREELLRLDFHRVTYSDDRVASLEYFQRALAGEIDTYSIAKRYLRKDGSTVWACLTVSMVRSAEGEPRNFIAIVQDISDRKRAEELLYQEKERAEITLHCIADGVITTNAAGTVEYLNPVAESLTEWATEMARGQSLETIFQVVDEQTHAFVANPVHDCLKERRITGLAEGSLLISRNGKEYAIEDSAAPIRTRDGEIIGAVLVFHDVTQTRRAKHQLVHEATHDALTGLVNRAEFERRLERALASVKAHGGHHSLCYLDLDNFKVVNDSVGHGAGDKLLKDVTTLMMSKIRGRDTLARLGGDEFSLLIENCPLDNALRIAEGLVGAIKDFRFVWEENRFAIGVSIGLVPITADSQSTAHLLTQADIACYTAKDLGRARVHIYHPRGGEGLRKHGEFSRIAHLRQALQRDQLLLYQQPIVALASASTGPVLRELLLRLVDTEDHLLLPRAFIPIAERYGLMVSIDRWVIENAFRYWGEQLAAYPNLGITINLSASSLSDESIPAFVRTQFSESSLLPSQVCFEITETSAVRNLTQAIKFMLDLKSNGCAFALDQFGSGPSSFYHLKKLPVDYLKIRGRLIRDMATDPISRSIVEAINDVGHALGMQTIAESVETNAILKELKKMGVDYAQGVVLGPPSAPQGLPSNVIH
ncbi:MAG: EAL domain-containing protein [Gammaproteobacteria bacterium]